MKYGNRKVHCIVCEQHLHYIQEQNAPNVNGGIYIRYGAGVGSKYRGDSGLMYLCDDCYSKKHDFFYNVRSDIEDEDGYSEALEKEAYYDSIAQKNIRFHTTDGVDQ